MMITTNDRKTTKTHPTAAKAFREDVDSHSSTLDLGSCDVSGAGAFMDPVLTFIVVGREVFVGGLGEDDCEVEMLLDDCIKSLDEVPVVGVVVLMLHLTRAFD
jgi:hypothetical protein